MRFHIAILMFVCADLLLAADLEFQTHARREPRFPATMAMTGQAAPSFDHPPEALQSEIDAFVESERAGQKIPGVAIAVVHHGTLFVAKGYGFANVEHQVPATAKTIFQAGSLGKQLTAAVALSLVEEGKLSLDEPVTKFLPAPPTWQPITIRHLLTHTSGIADWENGNLVDYWKTYTDDEFDRIIFAQALEFPAGARFNYCNTGYDLLGQILQKAAGQPLAPLYHDRLFHPAGMETARVISEADIIPHRAAGYEMVNDILQNQRWVAPCFNEAMASGCIYLSVLDLVAWDKAIREQRVLRPENWRAMFSATRLNSGKTFPYGFGWRIEEVDGQVVQEHDGAWQGFRSSIARFLRDELTIIVLANSADAETHAFVTGIAALFNPALGAWNLVPIRMGSAVGDPVAITDPDPQITARVRALLTDSAAGTLNAADFDYQHPGAFSVLAARLRHKLADSGTLQEVVLVGRRELGDDIAYRYTARFDTQRFTVNLWLAPNGKIARLHIAPVRPPAQASSPPSSSSSIHPPGEYVTVAGAKLWVESVGSGDPILLIAGGPGCSHGYLHPEFDALSATHRIIYFDALGCGRSDRAHSPSAYTLDRAVADVAGLLRELKVDPCLILGHSYGTLVAQALAIRHPELVSKLVLVSPVISAESWKEQNIRYLEICAQHYPDEWGELMKLRARGLRWSAPECRAISDKFETWLKSDYYDASNDAKLAPVFELETAVLDAMAGDGWEPDLTGTLAGFDFRADLKSLPMPILVMAGRWDGNTMPRHTRQYLDFAPQAQFVMLEHSGHHPFLEEPQLALSTLRTFLAR